MKKSRKMGMGAVESIFMERTRAMYSKHKERTGDKFNKGGFQIKWGRVLAYTLEDLRSIVLAFLKGAVTGCGLCPYCSRPVSIETVSLDHDMPLARGGDVTRQNLVCCCDPCNREKGKLTGAEFRQYLAFKRTLPEAAQNDISKRLRQGEGFTRMRFTDARKPKPQPAAPAEDSR